MEVELCRENQFCRKKYLWELLSSSGFKGLNPTASRSKPCCQLLFYTLVSNPQHCLLCSHVEPWSRLAGIQHRLLEPRACSKTGNTQNWQCWCTSRTSYPVCSVCKLKHWGCLVWFGMVWFMLVCLHLFFFLSATSSPSLLEQKKLQTIPLLTHVFSCPSSTLFYNTCLAVWVRSWDRQGLTPSKYVSSKPCNSQGQSTFSTGGTGACYSSGKSIQVGLQNWKQHDYGNQGTAERQIVCTGGCPWAQASSAGFAVEPGWRSAPPEHGSRHPQVSGMNCPLEVLPCSLK